MKPLWWVFYCVWRFSLHTVEAILIIHSRQSDVMEH